MSKKSTIITIVLAVVFTVPVFAADRIRVENDMQAHFDRNRDGFVAGDELGAFGEFAHIREKIVHLLKQADEGQEKVNRLRAEAEELENRLRREFGREEKPPQPEGPEAVERKINEMLEKAEQLQREGMGDKARQLRQQAEKLANDFREHQRQGAEAEFARVKERIVHLRELAEQAKKEGRLDKATDLWEESKRLEQELKREIEQRDAHLHAQEMENKIHRMFAEAEELEAKGHEDEAHGLREKAEKMAAEIQERQGTLEQGELEEMENEIRHLRELAEREKAAGRHEKARAIGREAEELKRHLLEIIEERSRHDDDDDEGDDDDKGDDDEEDELERLRDEVNELKEIVRSLQKEHADR